MSMLINPYRYALVTTLVADTFTRANGNLNASSPETGPNPWVSTAKGYTISSNVVLGNSVGYNAAWVDAGAADGSISFDLHIGGSATFCALAFRITDDNNFLAFAVESGSATKVYKKVATVATDLATGGPTPALNTTYAVRVVLNGTSIKCYLNGSLAHSLTDSTFLTNTKHGFVIYRDAQDSADNFLVTDAVA